MVSIILCTYNRENSIRYSIDSILEQTYQNWELIIVDDGSTDGTEKILEEYQDHRIRKIVLSDNSYYCYAANKGIREASGKYIAFATSDDIWEKTKLEKQIAYLEAHPECVEVEKHAVRQSFARIGHTLRHLPEDKQVFWFLLAFFCYIDGVYTIIDMAQRILEMIFTSNSYE